ncbi:DUF6090 family protein [Xanthomarina spongicola]|uniref:Uncharacterized protein n=1 Tax=Xanthomarina spongicola TaxID=570520 RepID=A0A316DJC6_9FLAO|nr:DUF6090 family protein [Xanthomarina spongicola]PWK18231.1 hypothetical protein LX78_02140 [Xanthomarina spongicola]
MLKFFRRIRQNLLIQNKTSKYFKYAIGEIILVMVGILLALQVNNWNEQRKEQKKEAVYLERLQENIATDLIQLDLNIEFYTQVFEYGSLALSYAEGDNVKPKNNWEVLVSFFHASQIWPFIPITSTYEELKSSGELSLIQSVKLRNSLSYYHGGGLQRYSHTVGIQPPYRKMVRGLIPAKIQNYMWDNCHVTDKVVQILKDCEPYIDELESKLILDNLTSNTVLLEELRFYMSGIKVGLNTIVEQRKLCQLMLDEINKIQNN